MKEQFATYEIALKLKELGFDEECFMLYIAGCFWGNLIPKSVTYRNSININDVTAPLWQQVIDWFREKHNRVINVYANASGYLFEMHDSAKKKGGTHRYDSGFDGPNEGGCWDSYYEAREQAILKAIKLCQNKKF